MNQRPDLEQLVSAYYPRIRRAASLLAGNCHEADDLAQETFVQAALAIQRYRGKSDPFVWLYGILLNVDRKRRRRINVWLRNIGNWIDLRASSTAAAGLADRENDLWSLVRRLPLRQRQAIVLRFGEGLSYAAIADVVGCPEGTAKSRVFHGLKTLRELVGESAEDHAPNFVNLDLAVGAEAAWLVKPEEP